MKTVYTLVMVIAIQVIAMCQTPGNQTGQVSKLLSPTIKRSSVKEASKEERSEMLAKRIEELNSQIKTLESLKDEINTEINQFFLAKNTDVQPGVETFIIPTTSGAASSNPDQLLKDASDLTRKANELRDEARTAGEEMKKQLLISSQNFIEMAVLKQIEASELAWIVTQEKYNRNKEEISTLLFNYSDKPYICAQVNYLVSQATYAMQMATEIREEAKELTDNAVKLGNYGNAEENEFIALNKQEEALGYFGTSYVASCKKKF
ncbi:MAG TPA: hypothetical protein VGF30_14275 [Bacteroidia bacterium]